jgi:hypothetical protein
VPQEELVKKSDPFDSFLFASPTPRHLHQCHLVLKEIVGVYKSRRRRRRRRRRKLVKEKKGNVKGSEGLQSWLAKKGPIFSSLKY